MKYIGLIIERRVTANKSQFQRIPLHVPPAHYSALLWITLQMEMSCPIKQFSPEHLECATKCCVKDQCTESDHCHSATRGHGLFLDYPFYSPMDWFSFGSKSALLRCSTICYITNKSWSCKFGPFWNVWNFRFLQVKHSEGCKCHRNMSFPRRWSALTVPWLIFLLWWAFLFMSGL